MPSCSLIPALPPSSRSCHPLGRYGSNGARTRSSSTALPAGILTPARRSSPGSSGTGANCASTAARCRCTTSPGSPTSHIPAPASQHGPGSWQQSGASPSWSARPATTRSMPNGHQPQSRPRHKSPESRMPGNLARPVRQGGCRKRTRELRAPRRTAYPTPVRRLVADTARCPDRDRLSLPENVPRACRQSPGRLHGPLCLPGAGAGQQRDEHLRVGASPACHRVPPRSGLVTGDRDYG